MCTDCFQTQKQIQEGFAIVQGKAKALAVKTGENVFIFQTPQGWEYIVESAAIQYKVQPTAIVSGLVPAS